jgi:hypothetical protein
LPEHHISRPNTGKSREWTDACLRRRLTKMSMDSQTSLLRANPGIDAMCHLRKSRLCGAVCNVAGPKPWLEATALVEAMHAAVSAAALKEDVVAVLGPSCCERSVDNGAPMTLAPKFRMSDNIFQEPVLTPSAQQIWRGDKHAGCNDLGVHG